MTHRRHLDDHHRSGRFFDSGGLRSFVLDRGSGPAVVLLHGVPASSFSFRKVVTALDRAGCRAVAFDLPGLGFADRPMGFDYTWTGLGRWVRTAIDDLGIDEFHLVVHDLGGPVGFEVVAADPLRVGSITILNSMLAVDGFRKPWVMRPFETAPIDRLWLAAMRPFTFLRLMRVLGVADRAVTDDELLVYLEQLRATDGGAAFLRIMKGFEPTAEKQQLYVRGVRSVPRRQVIWGELDPALRIETIGRATAQAADVESIDRLAAKHFVQEERPALIAERVARLVLG